MAKIPKSLRLTDDEIDRLMVTETRLRIATVGPDTGINLTPMTFGWAGRRVYIFGRGQKIADLRRSSTATVLIDVGEEWRELKGIMMRGKAFVLDTASDEELDEHLAEARRNLGVKHGLSKGGVQISYGVTASGRSRRWIVFQPETIVSWNNKKLH